GRAAHNWEWDDRVRRQFPNAKLVITVDALKERWVPSGSPVKIRRGPATVRGPNAAPSRSPRSARPRATGSGSREGDEHRPRARRPAPISPAQFPRGRERGRFVGLGLIGHPSSPPPARSLAGRGLVVRRTLIDEGWLDETVGDDQPRP